MQGITPGTIKVGISEALTCSGVPYQIISQKEWLVFTFKKKEDLQLFPYSLYYALHKHLEKSEVKQLVGEAQEVCNSPKTDFEALSEVLYGRKSLPPFDKRSAPLMGALRGADDEAQGGEQTRAHWITAVKVKKAYTVAINLKEIIEKGRETKINMLVGMSIEVLKSWPLPTLSTRQHQQIIKEVFDQKISKRDSIRVCQELEEYGILEANGHIRTRGRDIAWDRLDAVIAELEAVRK
jgi:hypothetical protein